VKGPAGAPPRGPWQLASRRRFPQAAAAGPPPGPVPYSGAATPVAPVGYPDGDLDAMVELSLGGTWTDITQWAMPDNSQYGQITSGQPDGAQQIQPARLNAKWDNGDARFSIRNTSGPYYGDLLQNIPARVSVASIWGTYLRLEDDGPDYAYTADTSALHITGSLEVRIDLMLSDWGACVFGARYGSSGTPSWLWGMQDDGTLLFTWFDSGAVQHTAVSTASVPYAPGEMALCVQLNAATGAVSFWAADVIDGTWAQLGSTVTGGATSVAAGNQPLTCGYSAYGGALGQVYGDVYAFRLYGGLSTAGGTVVADAAFSSQPDGTATWTDNAGLTWNAAGDAAISGRDYRLHGELASIAPTVATSGGAAKVAATISGPLRRMQQGNAPPTASPMTQALTSRSGALACVQLWPCEDKSGASQLASAVSGAPAMTFGSPAPQLSADSPFGTATLPLPDIGSTGWVGTIPAYTGGTAIVCRFIGGPPQASPGVGDYWPFLEIVTTGTVAYVQMALANSGTGFFALIGYASDGVTVLFNSAGAGLGNYGLSDPVLWSVEGVPVGGAVQWTLTGLEAGGSVVGTWSTTVSSATLGVATAVVVNQQEQALGSTSGGMIAVQSAWEDITNLADPLAAYAGELAATRFARICSEQGVTARVIGSAAGSAAMGPQPAGTVQSLLQGCVVTDGGIMFEPRTVFGLGMRTKASMLAQPAAVTLSFTEGNLPGSFSLLDDDQIVINDVTASDVTGTASNPDGGDTVRYTLDDGSPKSTGVLGEYATTVTLNVADVSQLATAAQWYVAARTADAPRASGLAADFGISGAPVADVARLRPGDLIVAEDPPETYQTADIRQIQMGATETFGPGRSIAWDCWPSAPWDSA
jgi:hypothetical protein